MNEQEIASQDVAQNPSTSAGLPGVARVEALPSAGRPPSSPVGIHTLMADFVGGAVRLIARALSPGLIESVLSASKRVGHYAVLASGALTIVYAIYGAIRYNSFSIFALGIGFVAALAVAQYAAVRFLGAGDSLIASTPSRISSTAFLDCVGLLLLLLAATTVLGGIAGAISTRSFMPIVPALIVGAILTSAGAVALHPHLVNVTPGEGTAGEEAIGILSFLFKTSLKLVPLVFLLLSVAGAVAIVASFFGENNAMSNLARGIVAALPIPVRAPSGLSGSALVLCACLVPIGMYFLFLLQYLFVDVLRSILAVPSKLDSLRR